VLSNSRASSNHLWKFLKRKPNLIWRINIAFEKKSSAVFYINLNGHPVIVLGKKITNWRYMWHLKMTLSMKMLKRYLNLHGDIRCYIMTGEEFIKLSTCWARKCSEQFAWTRINCWISPRRPTMTTPWRGTCISVQLTAPNGSPVGSFCTRWVARQRLYSNCPRHTTLYVHVIYGVDVNMEKIKLQNLFHKVWTALAT